MAWAPVFDSPFPLSSSLRVFMPPAAEPMARASTTKAIHPKIAFLRCCALQWAAREARLRVCTVPLRASGRSGVEGPPSHTPRPVSNGATRRCEVRLPVGELEPLERLRQRAPPTQYRAGPRPEPGTEP